MALNLIWFLMNLLQLSASSQMMAVSSRIICNTKTRSLSAISTKSNKFCGVMLRSVTLGHSNYVNIYPRKLRKNIKFISGNLALNSLNSIVMCVPKTTMIVSNFHTWLWKMLKWLGQSFFITWKASHITSSNGRSAEWGWFLDTKSTRDLYRKGNSMAVKLHNFSSVSISHVGKSVL